MGITIGEIYLLRAQDAYPYEMEEACELLNYALSYEESAAALTLLGKIQLEYLKKFGEAEETFLHAIAIDSSYMEAYEAYIDLLIYSERFERAEKIINHVLKMKTCCKAKFHRIKSVVHECRAEYDSAIESLKDALLYTYNLDYKEYLEAEITRVESKRVLFDSRKVTGIYDYKLV